MITGTERGRLRKTNGCRLTPSRSFLFHAPRHRRNQPERKYLRRSLRRSLRQFLRPLPKPLQRSCFRQLPPSNNTIAAMLHVWSMPKMSAKTKLKLKVMNEF